MRVDNPIAFPYRKMEYIPDFSTSEVLKHRYIGYTHNLAPICLVILDDVVPFVTIRCSAWWSRPQRGDKNRIFNNEAVIPIMFSPHINDILLMGKKTEEAYVVNLEHRPVSEETMVWLKNNAVAVEFRRGSVYSFVEKIVFESVSKVAEFNLRIS